MPIRNDKRTGVVLQRPTGSPGRGRTDRWAQAKAETGAWLRTVKAQTNGRTVKK
jgi:hypothetical protein